MAGTVRVLHVTEALGAGVGLSLARLVQLQAEAGAECVVLATRRYDTPGEEELRHWFGPEADLRVHPGGAASRTQLLWLARHLRALLVSEEFDAVHLHSSFAGLVGRLVALTVPTRRPRVFYSPHGFAFLREDLSKSRRALIRIAERCLAKLGGVLVLVSDSEREVARRRVGSRTKVLQNGVDLGRCRPSDRPAARLRPKVVMVGRITYQKAPWRFVDAAKRLRGVADFEWLGYGEAADRVRWLDGAPVAVSGPLPHDELLSRLRDADVIYFPTLWEGMPMSLIEAQASGVPAVASAIDGNTDVVADGVTGFLREDESELFEALELLVRDEERRRRFAVAAVQHADRFSDRQRGRTSLRIYGCDALG